MVVPTSADELRLLIQQGEGRSLEFKRSTAELETAIRTLSAFANEDGGTVLIGVAPDGRVVGAQIGANTLEEIAGRLTRTTDPVLYPRIERVTIDHRDVIAMAVESSPNRPHLASGKAWKRVGRSTVAMSRDEYDRLLAARRDVEFDAEPLDEAGVEALDEARARWYLDRAARERGIPVDLGLGWLDNLERLDVLRRRDGCVVPTAAAVLLFGRAPQTLFPHAVVRCARFEGTVPLNFISRRDLGGTLPEQIDGALAFVREHTRVAARISGFERREIAEYPSVAIREAVANAVAHRDYALRGDEVRLAIFDDRIEVQSPGLLPRPLTLRGLGQEHVLRNRRLAQLLFNIRYIENWNTGIHRMRAAMRAHGLPEPAFEELGHSFRVRFTGPGDRILDLVPEEGVTDLRTAGLNDRQVEALRLMVNEREEMSNERYRSLFDVAARTALRDLEGLVERGLAARRGTRRSTRYVAG
jgi:ATP-dependent DNA helicase RecG